MRTKRPVNMTLLWMSFGRTSSKVITPLRWRTVSAFISFGAIYYMVPLLWKREGLYSAKLAAWHFWIATLGIVLYITSMWVAGIMQGLMWRAYDKFGFLQYSFAESVNAMHPYYVIRMLGGLMFLTGALIMVFNLIMTVRSATTEIRPARAGAAVAGA